VVLHGQGGAERVEGREAGVGGGLLFIYFIFSLAEPLAVVDMGSGAAADKRYAPVDGVVYLYSTYRYRKKQAQGASAYLYICICSSWLSYAAAIETTQRCGCCRCCR
jgi:hypothetical protein